LSETDVAPLCGLFPFDGKPVNVALQGGGAHGAFTWGVLDELLADGRLSIEGLSGTSAGAMNAVVFADGMMAGGRDGAREALERFWFAVSEASRTSPFQRTFWDVMFGNWNLDYSPSFVFFDLLSRLASPYQLNPLNLNPLRDILVSTVNFERIRQCNRVKLFISATNVRTGRVKVFSHDELCPDAVLASACLPYVFQAVHIGDEIYWDGGFMGNPVLYPFFYKCTSPDIIIVQLNPFERPGEPTTAAEILDRVNEITFNASLLAEFRAMHFVQQMLDEGRIDDGRYKRLFPHMICSDRAMEGLTVSSKFNAEWQFLTYLRDQGRTACKEWLAQHFDDVGSRPSIDVKQYYMGKRA
jgi:NTE family protein